MIAAPKMHATAEPARTGDIVEIAVNLVFGGKDYRGSEAVVISTEDSTLMLQVQIPGLRNQPRVPQSFVRRVGTTNWRPLETVPAPVQLQSAAQQVTDKVAPTPLAPLVDVEPVIDWRPPRAPHEARVLITSDFYADRWAIRAVKRWYSDGTVHVWRPPYSTYCYRPGEYLPVAPQRLVPVEVDEFDLATGMALMGDPDPNTGDGLLDAELLEMHRRGSQ